MQVKKELMREDALVDLIIRNKEGLVGDRRLTALAGSWWTSAF